jgi:hypothetical protein
MPEIESILEEYGSLDDETPYFDFSEIEGPSKEYVCWVDIMGTRSYMKESEKDIAILFGKLHSAIVEEENSFPDITVYPVMDGTYIVSDSQEDILAYLDKLFSISGVVNLEHHYELDEPVFNIRGAVAYGPVIRGEQITEDASRELADEDNRWYTDRLLIGMPMIQAMKAESDAPPFGIYIHESARAFSPDDANPLSHVWWKWYENDHHQLAAALYDVLSAYFDRCKDRHREIPHYSKEKIKEHQEQLDQYFSDIVRK